MSGASQRGNSSFSRRVSYHMFLLYLIEHYLSSCKINIDRFLVQNKKKSVENVNLAALVNIIIMISCMRY